MPGTRPSFAQKSLLTLLPSIWCGAVAAPQRKPSGKTMSCISVSSTRFVNRLPIALIAQTVGACERERADGNRRVPERQPEAIRDDLRHRAGDRAEPVNGVARAQQTGTDQRE